MLQANTPDPLEDALPHPLLESAVTGAPGTVLTGNHLPLAARSKYVQDAIEDNTIRHLWPAVAPRRFVRRKKGFDDVPKIIRDPAESIPFLAASGHWTVLHDWSMEWIGSGKHSA